eukprot:5171229-Pleurochrysis_carterae.AAC.1
MTCAARDLRCVSSAKRRDLRKSCQDGFYVYFSAFMLKIICIRSICKLTVRKALCTFAGCGITTDTRGEGKL